jgi:hypothetical protein
MRAPRRSDGKWIALLPSLTGALAACLPHAAGSGPSGQSSANAIAAGPTVVASAPKSSPPIKACRSVLVRSLEIAAASIRLAPDLTPDAESVLALPSSAPGVTNVAAEGPVLGSMDSRQLASGLLCTDDGITLNVVITRSSSYAGAAAKNALWRPAVTLALELREPTVAFRVAWRLRLSNGEELLRSQTPPFAEQTYPIVVEKTLAAGSP